MEVLILLALIGATSAQYPVSPYYSTTSTTSVYPYYGGYYDTGYGYPYSGTSYSYPYTGTSSYGYPYTGSTGYGYPYSGNTEYGYPYSGNIGYGYPYTGNTGYGYPNTGTSGYGYGSYPYYGYTGSLLGGGGYGYPNGYPYTGIGTGTGVGTGIVGDPTGGTGGVGVITGTAPGGVIGVGTITGGTGLTSLSSTILGVNIPGTFTTGDTLIVTGIAPNCCPAGVKAGQGVWSISLLAANLSPICHIAIKTGWRNLVINSALNGWNGVWTSPTPQLQISTFSPNSPYTVQFTNLPTGLSIQMNNQPYTYPHMLGGGANVYAALGFVGYATGQVCSVVLIRGGVSNVLALGSCATVG